MSPLVALAAAAIALGPLPAPAQGPRAPQPALRALVPADTILLPPERFAFVVRRPSAARVVATVAPASVPESLAWRSDTIAASADTRVTWDLRGADGRWIPAGRYVLRVSALDSGGTVVSAESALDIARLPADTVPLPTPPGPSELLPETVQVRQTSPWAILIGAAAGLLPQLVGRRELNVNLSGDPKVWIVVGSVTAVGFLAIFTGHRAAYAPENVKSNAELLEDYRGRLAAAADANARARDAAGFRIRAGAAP